MRYGHVVNGYFIVMLRKDYKKENDQMALVEIVKLLGGKIIRKFKIDNSFLVHFNELVIDKKRLNQIICVESIQSNNIIRC